MYNVMRRASIVITYSTSILRVYVKNCPEDNGASSVQKNRMLSVGKLFARRMITAFEVSVENYIRSARRGKSAHIGNQLV